MIFYDRFRLKICFGLIVILVLILLGINFFIQRNYLPDLPLKRSAIRPTEIYLSLAIDVNKIPTKLMVYKYKEVKIEEDYIKKIMANLNIKGNLIHDKTSHYWIVNSDGKLLIIEDTTGKLFFYNLLAYEMLWHKEKMYFYPDKYIVAKTKQYLKMACIDFKKLNHFSIGYTTEKNQIVCKNICFYQQLQGHPILENPDVKVNIGPENQLISIFKYLRDLETYKEYPLKNIRQAFEELKEGKAQLKTPTEKLGEATVNKVTIAYYGYDKTYVQPVYIFDGEVETKDGLQPFEALVPAVENVNLISGKEG